VRVTYVVGSSHSGSTLLALLADAHPRVASVGETAVKPRVRREGRAQEQRCSCGETIERCSFWRDIVERVHRDGTRAGSTLWSHDYRFEHPWLDALLTRETSMVALRQLRGWMARHAPGYRHRVARIDRANVAFIRAVLSQRRAAVFLDTTKLLTRLTHLLEIPDLDVKVVQLVRDVRGFAASAKKRGHPVHEAAYVWHNDQRAIARALRSMPHERLWVMRYEDLCTRPRQTLARLWAFCGVEPFEVPLPVRASDHHVIGNSMRLKGTIELRLDEGWREHLDANDERSVLAVAGALNRQFGYV